MHICVLGSGILGLTTAYFLAEKGHEVTVLDRQDGPAKETSFANGGQLSYAHAEPWANPAVLPKIAKWLFKENSPLVLDPRRYDPDMWKWGVKFLRECVPNRVQENTLYILKLALESRESLRKIREHTNIEFNFMQKGILHIFTDPHLLAGAVTQAKFQAEHGCPYTVLSPEECVAMEPALRNIALKLKGAVFHDIDESGDIYQFCVGLEAYLRQAYGSKVTFRYGCEITGLRKEQNRIRAAVTTQGDVPSDAFVVAAGSYSPQLLRPVGIRLPIYPMKGYSISVPINGNPNAPTISITDQGSKIVYSRLGNILRSAGTAEFAGYNTDVTQKRIDHMQSEMQRLFGECGEFTNMTAWACLRPQTPGGIPYIGKSAIENLYLNTGHGTLGWTLGPGSSERLSNIL